VTHRDKAQLKALALHEAGHALACAAFRATPEIHMRYDVIGGTTFSNYERFTKAQNATATLAGLAAERIDKKKPGVVITERWDSPHSCTLNFPKCISSETGDLARLYDIAPEISLNSNTEKEFLNHHLNEAWLLLQKNREVLFELADFISYAENRHKLPEDCDEHEDVGATCHIFKFSKIRRILSKTR
jgi:hypothetical protein